MPRILIPSIKRFWPPKGKLGMAGCGILLGLSAPGYGLGWLAWLALIPVFQQLQQTERFKDALLKGFCFGAAFHMTWMAWLLGLHPLTWLGFSEVGSLLVAMGAWLTAGLLYGGLTAGILTLYWRAAHLRGRARMLGLLLFPVLWVLGFNLQQYWALGVPWAYLEYSQVDSSLLRQFARLTGSGSFIAGLLVAHNLYFAHWLKQPRPKTAYLTLGLLLTLIWAGSVLSPVPVTPPLPLPVTVLQGNLGIDVIRAGGLNDAVVESTYLNDLRRLPLAPGTLVVLPEEGALAGIIHEDTPLNNTSLEALQRIATQRDISLVSGGVLINAQHFYNVMVLIEPQQSGVHAPKLQYYAKRQLVPFGEFTPYLDGEWITGILERFGAGYVGSFDAGQDSRLLTASSAGKRSTKIGGLICFELIYPALSRQYRQQGADILVNVSNLGWFHGHPLLEQQFLAIGQMRAAETGLPVIISSNTGISAIISQDGRRIKITRSQHKDRLSF